MKKTITFLLSAVIILSSFFISNTPLCINADAASFEVDFETSSKSIYLENLDTGTVVFDKNADSRSYPASTTKIMTYIITAEKISDFIFHQKNPFVFVDASTYLFYEYSFFYQGNVIIYAKNSDRRNNGLFRLNEFLHAPRSDFFHSQKIKTGELV